LLKKINHIFKYLQRLLLSVKETNFSLFLNKKAEKKIFCFDKLLKECYVRRFFKHFFLANIYKKG